MTQIGTVKLQTQNSGVVDVPVFETGDSASGVFEFVRVETASGTGFIPVTDPADATYPYLRVQSQNNGIVAVTDTAGDDIPDSDVYLHDDWGDNRLTDRDDSGTTTYNGEEGVYRPEWTIRDDEPVVENEQITFNGRGQRPGESIYADINLNLNETITWEWEGVDVSDSGRDSGADALHFHAWAEQTSQDDGFRLYESYSITVRYDREITFRKVDDNGSDSMLIEGGSFTGVVDMSLTRSPSGEWELFINESSQGTETDTELTDPSVIAFVTSENADITLEEMKVF